MSDEKPLTLKRKPDRLVSGGVAPAEFTCPVHGDIGQALLTMTANVPDRQENRVYCLQCIMDQLDSLPIAQLKIDVASPGNSEPPGEKSS